MTTVETKSPSRGLGWPVLIVGLLFAHVIGMLSAVVLINHRTRSLGVVDNYYDQATHWDQHQAIARRSQLLGWHAKIDPSPDVDRNGSRPVTFTLTDAADRPIPNATLDVICTHPAHANAPAQHTFAPSPDGHFTQSLPMRYEGFYDFTLTAHVGDKEFVTTLTQWVNNSR